MATYNGELVDPPTSVIEADKAPRDAEIAIDVSATTVPRVSVELREGIVRRSTR